jgi:hypothetical protein
VRGPRGSQGNLSAGEGRQSLDQFEVPAPKRSFREAHLNNHRLRSSNS